MVKKAAVVAKDESKAVVSKEEMLAAAKEVNGLIEPAIDLKLKTPDLEKELLQAAEALDESDVSVETWKIFEKIQKKHATEEPKEPEAEAEEQEEAEAEAEEQEEAEAEAEEQEEEGEEGEETTEGEPEAEEEGEAEEQEEAKTEEAEETTQKKPEKKKGTKTEKTDKKRTPPKRTPEKTAKRIDFFIDLINEGKYTRNELIEKAVKEFDGASNAALSTILSDGTNPKYCKFPAILIVGKDKIVRFTDQKNPKSLSEKEVVVIEEPEHSEEPTKKEEPVVKKKETKKEKEPVAAPTKTTPPVKKTATVTKTPVKTPVTKKK